MPAWCHIEVGQDFGAAQACGGGGGGGNGFLGHCSAGEAQGQGGQCSGEGTHVKSFQKAARHRFLTAWTYYAALQQSPSVRFLTRFRIWAGPAYFAFFFWSYLRQ
jgi:hypothetical protein